MMSPRISCPGCRRVQHGCALLAQLANFAQQWDSMVNHFVFELHDKFKLPWFQCGEGHADCRVRYRYVFRGKAEQR
jgi:hypothetical protein